MKAIMIMYDSLNRHFLPGYGATNTSLPNFERLSSMSVQFDNCYVGSMPCMPARRELHTGRYNFLHRSWGPLEPFDVSMPEILKQNGIHTHLTTDHYHYFEDGGGTYHSRYSTYSSYRGQESDCWAASMEDIEPKQLLNLQEVDEGFRWIRAGHGVQNMRNRQRIKAEADFSQVQTFEDGITFLTENHDKDNWFLQIETFDPHEPFFSPENIQRGFFDPDQPIPEEDWPCYAKVNEPEGKVGVIKKKYAALLALCDKYLGKVLDKMDEYNLWDDTMLIVNTDHGFLLGEHGWWGKSIMPLYNEIANTPLYIWDPRSKAANEHRSALVQTIDLAPTILDFFKLPIPESMQGKALSNTIKNNAKIREAAIFGYFGDRINIVNERYVYMRAPIDPNGELNEYTLMPTHMGSRFSIEELKNSSLVEGMSFANGAPVLKIPAVGSMGMKYVAGSEHLLFERDTDQLQMRPLSDQDVEHELCELMVSLMRESGAPVEQYVRLGLPVPIN